MKLLHYLFYEYNIFILKVLFNNILIMTTIKDWKTYYTSSEVKDKLKARVRSKAKKIAKVIKAEINSKETLNV